MGDTKLTPALEERLLAAAPREALEVIVELDVPAPKGEGARALRIQAMKAAFSALSKGAIRAIRAAGGDVVDSAWINQTLRVRISASRVASLGDLTVVKRVDVPHALRPDASA